MDVTLSDYIASSENCRRSTLLVGMCGSCENVPSQRCCDVCTPAAFTSSDRLNILEVGKVVRRKKRVATRVVDSELLERLKTELCFEREKYLQENPCFCMIGAFFVCPDATIDEFCSQAAYVETLSDISLFGIKPELRVRFFKVICSVLSDLVHHKRQRCA